MFLLASVCWTNICLPSEYMELTETKDAIGHLQSSDSVALSCVLFIYVVDTSHKLDRAKAAHKSFNNSQKPIFSLLKG